ncbi:MAG TPA: hypothetical protein VGP95_22240 [Gemmatimonadaceae bacterium]|nr:hypothetical protein [Gemmatimonadaceae bacterium]
MRMPTRQSGTTPPAVPQAPVLAGPAPSIEALQAQAVELVARLAGLRTEQRLLQRQVQRAGQDAALRTEQIARLSDLNAQVARAEGQLTAVRAEVAQRLGLNQNQVGETAQPLPPPIFRQRQVDPDMVVGMSFVLAMCFVLPLSIAWAKRVWRGRSPMVVPKTDELAPRMERLEHAVDAIAIEIERIAEGQRFVTKIFTERPAVSPQRAPVDEAKAPLALGAGPIEPIRVAERQGVKQVNTPH